MREIDNNKLNSMHFTGIQKPQKEDVPAEIVAPQQETQEISDLSNMPAAALGKSQISTDSLETDMKVLERNPNLVQTLNAVIDDYADRHSENETLKMIEALHQEFTSKK